MPRPEVRRAGCCSTSTPPIRSPTRVLGIGGPRHAPALRVAAEPRRPVAIAHKNRAGRVEAFPARSGPTPRGASSSRPQVLRQTRGDGNTRRRTPCRTSTDSPPASWAGAGRRRRDRRLLELVTAIAARWSPRARRTPPRRRAAARDRARRASSRSSAGATAASRDRAGALQRWVMRRSITPGCTPTRPPIVGVDAQRRQSPLRSDRRDRPESGPTRLLLLDLWAGVTPSRLRRPTWMAWTGSECPPKVARCGSTVHAARPGRRDARDKWRRGWPVTGPSSIWARASSSVPATATVRAPYRPLHRQGPARLGSHLDNYETTTTAPAAPHSVSRWSRAST